MSELIIKEISIAFSWRDNVNKYKSININALYICLGLRGVRILEKEVLNLRTGNVNNDPISLIFSVTYFQNHKLNFVNNLRCVWNSFIHKNLGKDNISPVA